MVDPHLFLWHGSLSPPVGIYYTEEEREIVLYGRDRNDGDSTIRFVDRTVLLPPFISLSPAFLLLPFVLVDQEWVVEAAGCSAELRAPPGRHPTTHGMHGASSFHFFFARRPVGGRPADHGCSVRRPAAWSGGRPPTAHRWWSDGEGK